MFDLDGTLVDTVPARIEAWLATFDELRIPADRRHVAELIGSDGKRLAREVAAADGQPIDDERAEEIDRRAGQLYGELNRDPRPLPGAESLLRSLDVAGISWAIATSSRTKQVGASVAALRLPRAPVLVDGGRVAHAKPAPDLLLAAAEELGVRPARCWAVGDAVWDVMAAAAAGMTAVGVTAGSVVGADRLRQAGARVIVAELSELGPLLGLPTTAPPLRSS